MSIELERLEVKLDIDTSSIEQSISRFMPQIEGLLNRIEKATGRSGKKIENNMDMSDTTKKVESTLNDFVSNFTKQMDRMESVAKNKSQSTSRQIETGFKQTRTQAGKEIDLMVKDINAKLGQAKAAQGRIAELTAKRSASVKDNDTGKVINYDDQIARATSQMTSYENKAIQMARTMKAEFDAVPNSLSKISETMDLNEARIETMRSKIANMQKMYETQRKMTGNFNGGFGTTDSDKSLDTMIKIQSQTEKMNKLIASNDALQRAYTDTEDRARLLRKAIGLLDNGLAQSSIQTGNAALGMQNVAASSDKAGSIWSRFGGLFNRTSNFIAHGTRRSSSLMGGFFSIFGKGSNKATKDTNNMGKSTGMLGRTISQLARRVIVYGLLYKGIMALSKGMLSALKTNDQFASSLNQIQVNLMTAFYPIYQAVLPAINALMSAIARVTGYIASFVATLFGTTYAAAKKGAQGLYENVKALEETGSGASKAKDKVKELQRSLMGFDEINRIGLDVNADDSLDSGSGGTGSRLDFDTPNYDTPAWLTNFANNARDIFSKLFDPMKTAWDKHGRSVMDALKYSVSEVWGLTKAVGASFMEVWTNGTGEEFISNILLLLANVLNIIGDISKSFKDAWNDEGRGTALIQSIFNSLNEVLNLINVIAVSFREAWNDGSGELFATNLLEIFTNLFDIVGNLASQFSKAWKEGGVGTSILSGVLDIVNDIFGTVKNLTESTADWASQLDFTALLNSIDGLLKSISPLSEKIGEGLSWFYQEVLLPIGKWAIEDAIPAFLDTLSEALTVLNEIIEALKPTFQWLWDEFLQPVAEWGGGTIVSALENLRDALSGISDWIKENQTLVQNIALVIGSFAAAWGIVSLAIGAWNIVAGIAKVVTGALATAVGFLTSPFGIAVVAIGAIIAIGVLLWKNWDTIMEKVSKLGGWISEKWDGIKKKTSETWDNVSKWVKDKSEESRKKGSENAEKLRIATVNAWDTVKKKTSENWTNISNAVRDKSESARKWGSDKLTNLKNTVSSQWNNLKTDTSNRWQDIASKISTKASEARTNATNAFQNIGKKASEYGGNVKTALGGAFDTVASWASTFGTKVANGLRGGIGAIKSAAASIGNGLQNVIKSAVNGVIGGINWVLDKVGTKTRLATWAPTPIKAYAQGTGYHPGGIAMVNDGLGRNFQEAYEVNGKVGLFPRQRNMLVDLPRGAKVLDGNRTAMMYGGAIPQYANGIGNWLSKAWNGAKQMVGTVWDYVSNPSKLLDIAISQFTNLSGALEPALSIAKGGISTIASGATSFIKGHLEKGSASPAGKGVERWRPTVIRALSMNGLPTSEPYVNAWLRQIKSESGGNEKAIQGNIGDINNRTGDLAKGLVQVIGQTFEAYKFPGHNNRLNGLDSLLAGINYAKNRYGASGMLQVIGHGHGYENGGLVTRSSYRVGEGNKKELIIPLERRNRALELLEVAKDYLGVSDIAPLRMPEMMLDTPNSRLSVPASNHEVGGGGLSGMSNSLETLIHTLISTNNQGGSNNVEVTLEIDRTKLGKVVIKEINEVIDKTGKIPLDL